MDHSALRESLAAVVGPDYVLTDDDSRTFFSTDVFRQADELAAVVVQPGTVEDLQALVRVCAQQKAPMVVRGGGASYTDGYLPTKPGTVLFEMSRLKGIEINAQNMTVTVEPGDYQLTAEAKGLFVHVDFEEVQARMQRRRTGSEAGG